jgi:hypothetical protein
LRLELVFFFTCVLKLRPDHTTREKANVVCII